METQNEIDLLTIVRKSGHWGYGILRCTVIFFLQKWLWWLIAVGVALLLCFAYCRCNNANYSSTVALRSNALSNGEAINFINDNLASPGERDLNRIIALPDSAFACLKSVSAHFGIDYNNDGSVDRIDFANRYRTDTARTGRLLPHQFFVHIRWKCKASAPTTGQKSKYLHQVAAAIVALFNNDAYIQRVNAVRLTQIKKRIAMLDDVDSLQRIKFLASMDKSTVGNLKVNANGQLLLASNADKFPLTDMLDLTNQRLKLQQEQALYAAPVSLMTDAGISTQKQVEFAELAPYVVGVALLFTILLALVWNNRKWIAVHSKG